MPARDLVPIAMRFLPWHMGFILHVYSICMHMHAYTLLQINVLTTKVVQCMHGTLDLQLQMRLHGKAKSVLFCTTSCMQCMEPETCSVNVLVFKRCHFYSYIAIDVFCRIASMHLKVAIYIECMCIMACLHAKVGVCAMAHIS